MVLTALPVKTGLTGLEGLHNISLLLDQLLFRGL